MSSESYADTVQQLAKLVTLRNDVAHHFIDRYNVWTAEGCRDAIAYLDDAYLRVDSHYATLAAWAKSMLNAHSMTASFLASEAWEDFVIHGIAPEGTVDWTRATVVELLRESAAAQGKTGWTNLADAIGGIAALHPDQNPKRYASQTQATKTSLSSNF